MHPTSAFSKTQSHDAMTDARPSWAKRANKCRGEFNDM